MSLSSEPAFRPMTAPGVELDDTGPILLLTYKSAAEEAAYRTMTGQDDEAREDRYLREKEIVTRYMARVWYPRFDPVWTILYTALRELWFDDPNPLGLILSWRKLEERVPWERTTLRRFVESYADPAFVPVRTKYREGWPYFRTMLQIRKPTNYHGPGDEAPWQYKPLIQDLLHRDDWTRFSQLSGQGSLFVPELPDHEQNAHGKRPSGGTDHVQFGSQNAHGSSSEHGQIAHGPSGGAADRVQFGTQNAHGSGPGHGQNAHDPGAPPPTQQAKGVQIAHPNSSEHGQIAHGRSGQASTATAVPPADHVQFAHLSDACMHAVCVLADSACMLLQESIPGTSRTRAHCLLNPEIAREFTQENIPANVDPALAIRCLQTWGYEERDATELLFRQPLEVPYRDEAAKWAILWSAWGVVLWTENGGTIYNVAGSIRNIVRRACMGMKKDRTMPAAFYKLYATERRKQAREAPRVVAQTVAPPPAEFLKRWELLARVTYPLVANFVKNYCTLDVQDDGAWVVRCPKSKEWQRLDRATDNLRQQLREYDPHFPPLEFVT